jgi:hypothetical protein
VRILFLHGWTSTPGGKKPTFLASHGHIVLNPKLPDDDFDEAVRIAPSEYDQGQPDVVVGSSRGGAVAINIDTKDTPIVLLCPAWKKWGAATTVKMNTTILHSRADDVVPFENSIELIANSGLPTEGLIEVGTDHRLADPEPLRTMLEACEKCVGTAVVVPRSLAELVAGFKSYMRNRLCGIVFAESKGQKKPHFEIGSGFVIEAEGLYVLVTAGHIFEKIAQLHEGDRLIGASLVVPSGPRSVAELSLFPEDLATARYCPSSEFDVVFMCISPDLVQHLRTAGLVAVKRALVDPPSTKQAKRVLVGYGADGAHLHDQEIFCTVENNVIRPRIKTQLGAVPFKIVGLRDSTTDDGVNFRAVPEVDDIPTLAGLSGGVVVDVFVNEPIRNYAWIGVQSTQHTVVKHGEEVVTQVKFTSATAVAEMADNYATEFLADLERDKPES